MTDRQKDSWPDELFGADEWPDVVKKPDALYLSSATVFVDGARVGECEEAEIELRTRDEEAEQAAEPVKRLNVVPCPNPDCDPEDGCCVCEHTGRVYQFVIDAMTVAEQAAEALAERLEDEGRREMNYTLLGEWRG